MDAKFAVPASQHRSMLLTASQLRHLYSTERYPMKRAKSGADQPRDIHKQGSDALLETANKKSQTDWIIPVDSNIDFTFNLHTKNGKVSLRDVATTDAPRDPPETYRLPPSPSDTCDDHGRDFGPAGSSRRLLKEYRPLSPARTPTSRADRSLSPTHITARLDRSLSPTYITARLDRSLSPTYITARLDRSLSPTHITARLDRSLSPNYIAARLDRSLSPTHITAHLDRSLSPIEANRFARPSSPRMCQRFERPLSPPYSQRFERPLSLATTTTSRLGISTNSPRKFERPLETSVKHFARPLSPTHRRERSPSPDCVPTYRAETPTSPGTLMIDEGPLPQFQNTSTYVPLNHPEKSSEFSYHQLTDNSRSYMRNRATIEHHPTPGQLKSRQSPFIEKSSEFTRKFKHKLFRYRTSNGTMGTSPSSIENPDSDSNSSLKVVDIIDSTLRSALDVQTATSSGLNANSGIRSDLSANEPVSTSNTPERRMNNMADSCSSFPSPDTPGNPTFYKEGQYASLAGGFPYLPSYGSLPRYSSMLTVLNPRDAVSDSVSEMDARAMNAQTAKHSDDFAMKQIDQAKLLAEMRQMPSTRSIADMAYALNKYPPISDASPHSHVRFLDAEHHAEGGASLYSDSLDYKPNTRDYNVNIIDLGQSSPVSEDGNNKGVASPKPNVEQLHLYGGGQVTSCGTTTANHNKYNMATSVTSHSLSVSQTIADSLRLCSGNGKVEHMESPCVYGMDHGMDHRRLLPPSPAGYMPQNDLLLCTEIKKEFDANSECSFSGKEINGQEAYGVSNMSYSRLQSIDSMSRKRNSQSSFGSDSDSSGVRSPKPTKYRKAIESILCYVCGDSASGFHCGAYVCEACKKFFIRSSKNDSVKFVCSKQKKCAVTKESRTQCQSCRYEKCLLIGMFKPGSNPLNAMNANMSNFPCRVCGAPSSGYHFGAITCEGCKGFFRRTIKERDSHRYVCPKRGQCTVTLITRNFCKFCRYQKCLQVGMTPEGSRIGRQPNSVKHATLLELHQISATGSDPASSSSSEPPTPKDVASPFLTRRAEKKFSDDDMDVVISSLMSSYNHLVLLRKKPEGVRDIPDYAIEVVWDYMMKQFIHDAHNVLRFAKKIPGFKALPLDDQISLLQNSMYQVCIFLHLDQYDPSSDEMNYFNFSPEDRKAIMQHFPGFSVFEKHYHYFGQAFGPLGLDAVETACMVALQIVSPVDSAMKTWKEIAQIQETITISLQMYIERRVGPDSDRFGLMLLQLPSLNSAGIKHQQVVTALRNEQPLLPFPQLFTELFLSYDEHESISAEDQSLLERGLELCERMINNIPEDALITSQST